jgi:hypothetical protein
MSRTNRSTVRRPRHFIDLVNGEALEFHPDLVPIDHHFSGDGARLTLEAVLRTRRWQLVSAARQHLGPQRGLAEDLVQDLCLEVLEGQLLLSSNPTEALDQLLREIAERSDR